MSFDESVFKWAFGFAHRSTVLDSLAVALGVYLPYVFVGIFVFLVLRQKHARLKIFFVCLAIFSVILSRGIITESIRFAYHKPRPAEVLMIESLVQKNGEAAFPSGHMALLIPIALTAMGMSRKWGIALLAIAIGVGAARIFIGVHWPVDILGGVVVGLASYLFAWRLFLPYRLNLVERKMGISEDQTLH